ncbi:MAG: GIY-YIG nuclease family protein [Patescibacteria group bacterium]
MYFLYLLECRDKSIYTGITTDVARRFKEHKAGIASRYTRARQAVKVLHTERFKTRSEALKRESEIKKWRRDKKISLIHSGLL